MPWVCFTCNYDWQPRPRIVFAYKAGKTYLVKAIVAEQAIAAGKAKPAERPDNATSRRSKVSSRLLHP